MSKEFNKQELSELCRQMKREEEIKGFKIHRAVYLCVITLLAIINFSFVPGFTWFIFPLVGWGMGLTIHYLGIKDLKENGIS